MPDFILLVAAAMMTLAFYVHVVVGGRHVARPLLADRRLPPPAKWLSYYCWHIVSLMILTFVGMLTYWAFRAPDRLSLVFTAAFFAVCGGMSAWVATKGKIAPLRFPSTSLFFALALCVAADLLANGQVR